jgi:NAD(P)-dependent dehydrogenase (short-subunit alcohol dehydrogenase family)
MTSCRRIGLPVQIAGLEIVRRKTMKRSRKSIPSEERVLPSMHVSGKTALVTGAGSGLGRSIALALAEAGADVAVTELPSRLENAQAVAASIRSMGREALVVKLDVSSVKSIERAVAEVARGFSRIDVLVNNAGINIPKQALEVTEDDWDRVLDVNLKGVFFCAQAVGREMVRRGSGKIINIASQNGVVGYHDRAAYCSSKAGVVNLTRVLAIEWAPHKINVNAVAPTFVLTPLTEKMFANPLFSREIHRRIPLGRLGKPEDIVGAVVFLASPAADLITGHTLLVDGGWTAI